MYLEVKGQGFLGLAPSVLPILAYSLIAYLLLIIIYRIALHPLAKYPGPFLAKITNLYSLYYAWKGSRHIDSFRCHERYGDVYRCGPNSLSFNTASALQAIYGPKSNCWKGEFYTMLPAKKGAYSVHSEINKERHAQRRRVISHAFSDRALKAVEGYILSQIRIFCAQVGSSPQPRNMAHQCDRLTIDVLGDLCFGKTFGTQERPDNRFVLDLVQKSTKTVLINATMPAIANWGLDNFLFRRLKQGRARFAKFCIGQANERTKATTEKKDFFYYILNAKDENAGEGLTMPELWAETSLLIVAGSDTTSTALAATFFYLTRNREALQKLNTEIRGTFADVEAIKSGPALSSCLYLRACIDETLRYTPPIGGFLPREVLSGGVTIDSHCLPAGTVVGASAYAIHHNPRYFPSPFEYRPERWLVSSDPKAEVINKKEDVELAKLAFCPFSLGPRSCIGMSMAYMELMITVARVMFLFDIKLAGVLGEGSSELEPGRQRRGEYQLKDVFVSCTDGPMVEFVKRGD